METPFDTTEYWKARYAAGRGSGDGSRGPEAIAKAQLIDRCIAFTGAKTVLDFGCGDGHVASLVTAWKEQWVPYDPALGFAKPTGRFDLVLSFDVLFHLPGDEEYRTYLRELFEYSLRHVLIWSTNNTDTEGTYHVREREWVPDVPKGWHLVHGTGGWTGFEKKGFWLWERD